MLIKRIKCKPRQFTDQNTITDKKENITSLIQYFRTTIIYNNTAC